MAGFPSVFPYWWIALTAGIAFVASLAVLWILRRRGYTSSAGEMLVLALVVGLSVLFWRSAGNVAQLNDDPIPPFSPNDLLCPVVTFVSLELAAALHRPADTAHWGKKRAWLTLVSFIVNVLTI